jgi:hypothetical protein
MALFLIGVVHRDPRGYGKLLGLLEGLEPEAITVELSPFGLLWREREGRRLLEKLNAMLKGFPPDAGDHPEVILLRLTLDLPFEYLASWDYARGKGLSVHLVDVNWISRRELPLVEKEALTERNLKELLAREPRCLDMAFRSAYGKALKCIQGERSLVEVGVFPPWSTFIGLLRERILACRIEKIASLYTKVVHVGGWIHMVSDPTGKSMASLLNHLHPEKILLAS